MASCFLYMVNGKHSERERDCPESGVTSLLTLEVILQPLCVDYWPWQCSDKWPWRTSFWWGGLCASVGETWSRADEMVSAPRASLMLQDCWGNPLEPPPTAGHQVTASQGAQTQPCREKVHLHYSYRPRQCHTPSAIRITRDVLR